MVFDEMRRCSLRSKQIRRFVSECIRYIEETYRISHFGCDQRGDGASFDEHKVIVNFDVHSTSLRNLPSLAVSTTFGYVAPGISGGRFDKLVEINEIAGVFRSSQEDDFVQQTSIAFNILLSDFNVSNKITDQARKPKHVNSIAGPQPLNVGHKRQVQLLENSLGSQGSQQAAAGADPTGDCVAHKRL